MRGIDNHDNDGRADDNHDIGCFDDHDDERLRLPDIDDHDRRSWHDYDDYDHNHDDDRGALSLQIPGLLRHE